MHYRIGSRTKVLQPLDQPSHAATNLTLTNFHLFFMKNNFKLTIKFNANSNVEIDNQTYGIHIG